MRCTITEIENFLKDCMRNAAEIDMDKDNREPTEVNGNNEENEDIGND